MFHGLYKTDCVQRHRKVRDVLLCEGVTLSVVHPLISSVRQMLLIIVILKFFVVVLVIVFVF